MAVPCGVHLDHIAHAVRDLEAAVAWYEDGLGGQVVHREVVERDGIEEAFLELGDGFVQLLCPTREDSPVARFLQDHGEGLHHVAYRVNDCAAALHQAVTAGGVAIDTAPRPGSRGTTVVFLHPRSAFGTLIELVEEAK